MGGSCWAFSATESVESAYILAGIAPVVMAPQELVDCSRGILSNHGCKGGMYYNAWKWEKDNPVDRCRARLPALRCLGDSDAVQRGRSSWGWHYNGDVGRDPNFAIAEHTWPGLVNKE